MLRVFIRSSSAGWSLLTFGGFLGGAGRAVVVDRGDAAAIARLHAAYGADNVRLEAVDPDSLH